MVYLYRGGPMISGSAWRRQDAGHGPRLHEGWDVTTIDYRQESGAADIAVNNASSHACSFAKK